MRRAEPIKTAPVPTIERPSAEDANPHGVSYVEMLRAGKVGDRWCLVGDIIKVESLQLGKVLIGDRRLDAHYANRLIAMGFARSYTLKPGDKVVNVVSDPPKRLPLPTAPPQYAMLAPQKTAEKAVTDRQKAGAI